MKQTTNATNASSAAEAARPNLAPEPRIFAWLVTNTADRLRRALGEMLVAVIDLEGMLAETAPEDASELVERARGHFAEASVAVTRLEHDAAFPLVDPDDVWTPVFRDEVQALLVTIRKLAKCARVDDRSDAQAIAHRMNSVFADASVGVFELAELVTAAHERGAA